MCWRAVIGSVWLTTNSRKNVKARGFPWQHLRKPQSTAAAEQTDRKTRLRSSVEIQRKLDSQFQQVFHAKVRALIRKAVDPETWDERIWIFTLVNLELPCSPELARCAQVAHSVRRQWIHLVWRSCRSLHETGTLQDNAYPSQDLPPPSLLPTRPITEIISDNSQDTKDIHSIDWSGWAGSGKYIGGPSKMHAFYRKVNPPEIQWCF